jgi:hypothetical protein
LSFADTAKLKKEGRNFDCSVCPKRVQELRRCWEPGEFTYRDNGSVFPIYIHEGGQGYGFCPSKVYRDEEAVSYYRLLIVIAETGTMPNAGGLYDQDKELVDDLGIFLPIYDQLKWGQKISALAGGAKKSGSK